MLLALVALLGPSLARIPLPIVQLAVGTLLLMFGLRWLRKAILRAAGVIALHNEEKEFAETEAALRGSVAGAGFDTGAALTSFNGVFIEGIEVVFLVISMGAASHHLAAASAGISSAS